MSNTLNLDSVVEHVKTLVECNRCLICDKLDGSRWRYKCGHVACGECIEGDSHCVFCLTPPGCSTPNVPDFDGLLTQRISHISSLLKTCEETFGIDVYKRHRISQQLKIEKEVFPECIQASITYSNKRKSTSFVKDKENRSPFFPGENISPLKKTLEQNMENSNSYVQEWFKQNEKLCEIQPRRPFADLNVNQALSKKVYKNTKEANISSRKRSLYKTALSASGQLIENRHLNSNKKFDVKSNNKRIKKEFDQKETGKKNEKDESGIEMDDEAIVIDDSQSQIIDKDKRAWLAVLEADKLEPYVCTPSTNLEQNDVVKVSDIGNKAEIKTFSIQTQMKDHSQTVAVPFLKKSYLIETCKLCKCETRDSNKKLLVQSKGVQITIESSNFITSINMNTVKNNCKFLGKHSAATQTDIKAMMELDKVVKEHNTNTALDTRKSEEPMSHSQDLFTADMKTDVQENHESVKKESEEKQVKKVVIADSDSDDANESSVIQVTAEVHRSSDQIEYGVLSEISDVNELQHRTKHSKRGQSPTSSNSSEKENYDPNKTKRLRLGKKGSDKKRAGKKLKIF